MRGCAKITSGILHHRLVFIKFTASKWFAFRSYAGLLLLFTIYVSGSRAAFDKLEAGAATLAIGNAAVALAGSPQAIHYNPAAIRFNGMLGVALSYRSFYGLKEVGQADLIINFFFAGQSFSFGINRFGNRYYSEIQGSLGSYYDLDNQLCLGVSLHVYHLQIKGYGQDLTWGINFGVLYELLPSLFFGALVTNLNRPKLAVMREKIPQIMTFGLNFLAMQEMRLFFVVYRDVHFKADYRAGVSYQPASVFTVRAGIEDGTETVSVGCGINFSDFSFDYALRMHQILGPSHVVSFHLSL